MRSRTRTLIIVLASAALLAAASGLARAHGSRPRGGTLERGLQIRVVQAINAMRQRHGLVALRVDGGLVAAAAEHSRAMAEKGYFAHAGRDGSSVEARLRRHYRVRSHGYWLVGEILAWGSPRLSPAGAVRRWLADREHRLDLLDPAWRDIGVGALHELSVPGVYGGRETTIITVDFGVRS